MISKNWTDEERLKIVLLLAEVIQKDIPAGQYSACREGPEGLQCRPNMQSIIEIILRPADHLEEQREGIEAACLEQLKEIDHDPKEFWETTLDAARQTIFGECPKCEFDS